MEAGQRLPEQTEAGNVVAFDYGVKRNILRMLAERGCKLTVCRRRRLPKRWR